MVVTAVVVDGVTLVVDVAGVSDQSSPHATVANAMATPPVRASTTRASGVCAKVLRIDEVQSFDDP